MHIVDRAAVDRVLDAIIDLIEWGRSLKGAQLHKNLAERGHTFTLKRIGIVDGIGSS